MDKQVVIYPYMRILFSHKKAWNTDICYNMAESQKLDGKWKPTEGYILDHCIYMKYLE